MTRRITWLKYLGSHLYKHPNLEPTKVKRGTNQSPRVTLIPSYVIMLHNLSLIILSNFAYARWSNCLLKHSFPMLYETSGWSFKKSLLIRNSGFLHFLIFGCIITICWSGFNRWCKRYLCFSIRLLVSNNLNPAIFSTARLLKNPTSPVTKPIRSARVHLRTTYWNIWAFFLDLQSSLYRSFSTILQKVESSSIIDKILIYPNYNLYNKPK